MTLALWIVLFFGGFLMFNLYIYIYLHTYIYIYIRINTYIYLFICVFFSGSILEVGYHLVEPQCSWDFGEVSP